MATQWWREPWRKLYTKLDAQWLGLSVSARGLGDELIKYAGADGRLFQVDSPSEAGKEIARRLSAKPREYKRIAEDTRELIDDTYLVLADGWLFIRNFRDAQERLSPEARRQRAKRERDRAQEHERDMSRDITVTEGVTTERDSHRESIRSESSRDENLLSRAGAHVERPSDTDMLAAWEAADLPGSPLLTYVAAEIARTPEKQRPTPKSACAAYKQLVDAWRATKRFPRVSAENMLHNWSYVVDIARGAVKAEDIARGAEVTKSKPTDEQTNRPRIPSVKDLRYKDGL